MSILKKQNFGFGAGLTALFDYNPKILPSFIEDVKEPPIDGKKPRITSGKFFKVTTPKDNEFTVYIKYSDKIIKNDKMVSGFMWEFSLTEVEKNKIELQYQNTGGLLILLVCINGTDVNLESQVALLRWEDYCKIRHRHNIQIGIWKNVGTERQSAKVFCLRKGKGQKKEYFLEIKRNFIEKPLDELYMSDIQDDLYLFQKEKAVSKESLKEDSVPESQYVEVEPETVLENNDNKKQIVYLKDNIKWCGKCREETVVDKIQYIGMTGKRALQGYGCSQCGQFYITPKVYEDNLKANINKKSNLEIKRIKTLVDKVYFAPRNGCVYCDSQLSISPCRLKIYKNLAENNQMESIVDTELFYCKNCGIYYAKTEWKSNLLKKYGKNKINFAEVSKR